MHEYLFKKKGELFGPVEPDRVRELLYRGEIDAHTPVAGPDGAWRTLGAVPEFLVDVKKAEAQLRVEREVTGARDLARRKAALRGGAAVGGALALAVLVALGAVWLARAKPWRSRSALLEDFGGGIAIVSPARIGGTSRQREDEIDLGDLPPIPGAPGGSRSARPSAPAGGRGAAAGRGLSSASPSGAPASGSIGEGGDLVSAQYDEAAIQEVVSREQRTLVPCLKEASRAEPGFAGDIPVEFAIGNDGRVARLWVDEPRFRAGPLHACMLRVLQAWKFRPFPGQRPTVSLSFRVSPE
jgi:hypothetical protein